MQDLWEGEAAPPSRTSLPVSSSCFRKGTGTAALQVQGANWPIWEQKRGHLSFSHTEPSCTGSTGRSSVHSRYIK